MSKQSSASKAMRSEAWRLIVEALDEADPQWMKGATECAAVTAVNWIRRTILERDEARSAATALAVRLAELLIGSTADFEVWQGQQSEEAIERARKLVETQQCDS